MEAINQPFAQCFGIDGMKQMRVCPHCGGAASAKLHVCPDCGRKLLQSNLFQLYQRSHRLCPVCDTVLSDSMHFCPHCGNNVEPGSSRA